MPGTLYLCATPIGNLEDITYRCVRILKEVDLIAAEDTRRTLTLLNHLGIEKPLTSYYEHNKAEKGPYLVQKLADGCNVALVSDAGTPAICDPGEDLVKLCIEAGITVVPVPGPVAAVTALISSGLSTIKFVFEGFISTNRKNRIELFERLKNETRTMIFYEAPHKLLNTLSDMLKYFGNRKIAIVRELTKLHESVSHTTLEDAISYYTDNAPRGEFVLIVAGADKEQENYTLEDAVKIALKLIDDGMSTSSAAKEAAALTGQKKGDIYKCVLNN